MWSKRVRTYRQGSGLTQEQFAERCGVEPRTVQRWEAGKTTPPQCIQSMLTTGNRDVSLTPGASVIRSVVEASSDSAMLLDAKLNVLAASMHQRNWMRDTYGCDMLGVHWPRYMSPFSRDLLDKQGGLDRLVKGGLAYAKSVYHLPANTNGNSVAHTRLVQHTVLRFDGYDVLHMCTATPLPLDGVIEPPTVDWLP
jgi:transcriptional regulator with XRE-family HTH domain